MEKKTKLYTLMFVLQEGQILLGMKKRGFGNGKYNGFGGKVENGETIQQAAIRETIEESGLTPLDAQVQGYIRCIYDCEPNILKVYIFRANQVKGEIKETDEMRPEWFPLSQIPFSKMWADDPIWMPHMLDGKHFTSTIDFIGHDKIVNADIKLITREEIEKELGTDNEHK